LVNTQFIYTQGPATISANWRWISSGVLENSFYDTATGPLTVDQNNIPAVSYVDLGATYKLKAAGHDLEFYARVSNLFDKSPPVIPNTNTFWQQYNGALYDGIGRYYRAGMRFQF
jgi:iron complex outermembrane receptor protein